MTRENKLALVIGFGLVLFVGILISDHFSTARTQESADLRSDRGADPLMAGRQSNARLFDVASSDGSERQERERSSRAIQPGPVAVNTRHIITGSNEREQSNSEVRQIDPERENQQTRIVMGGSDRNDADENVTIHSVRRGESLIAIAREHYGDGSLVQELARYNNLSDPNQLSVGDRLRIPPASRLRNGQPAQATEAETSERSQSQPEPDPVYTMHTVQRGETLSEIAQKLLGSARRWREIYEMNSDAIRDPDNVPAGTELKIPRP